MYKKINVIGLVVLLTSSFVVLAENLNRRYNGNVNIVTQINNSQVLNNILQKNDKILALVKNNNQLFLEQYNDCGSLDTNFGNDGAIAFGNNVVINSINVLSNNNIIVAGSSDNKFFISQYDNTGNPDYSFGDRAYLVRTGNVITSIGNSANVASVLIQTNGKIIAAGNSDNKIALASYLSDGTLDTTFGVNGIQLISLGLQNQLNNIYLDNDGKILVVATIDNKFSIIKLNNHGNLDHVFCTQSS